eukprot:392615_1
MSTTSEFDYNIVPDGAYIVIYASFIMLVGCLIMYIQNRFRRITIPYTAWLLIIGFLFGLMEENISNFNLGFQLVRELQPDVILSPILIFVGAFNTNYHTFRVQASQVTILSVIGVMINSMLIGRVMHYFVASISALNINGFENTEYQWSWSFSFMFGAIISATDSGIMIKEIRQIGVSNKLCTLIESESAVTAGTAFILFDVERRIAASDYFGNIEWNSVILNSLQLVLGGIAFGIVSGMIICYCLSRIYSNYAVEIVFTLCAVYLFAFLGEFPLGVGSSLSLVFIGLLLSKKKQVISPDVASWMVIFWGTADFMANTILFFFIGQEVCFQIYNTQHINWFMDSFILIFVYIMCHITRSVMILSLYPLLKITGYGCTIKNSFILMYSGMPGAIGLALALIVQIQPEFSVIDRNRVLFHICGIVILTSIINTSTIKWLAKCLRLDKPPPNTAALFASRMKQLKKAMHEKKNEMKLADQFSETNWLKVNEISPKYDQVYEKIFGKKMDSESDRKDDDNIEQLEDTVIQVMKETYWKQYEQGMHSTMSD